MNVSSGSPLKDFLVLILGILGALFFIYLLLGFMVDLFLPHLPLTIEKKIGEIFHEKFLAKHQISSKEKELNILLHKLTKDIKEEYGPFHAYIIKNKEVNALAFAGGRIIVFEGLLDNISSEAEIAFVLAHELSHFLHRDHLRTLGRSILFIPVSIIFFGQENYLTDFLLNSVMTLELDHSRRSEKAADLLALEILAKNYKDSSGAVKFMKRIAKNEKWSKVSTYLSTHPHPEERIKYISQELNQKSLSLRLRLSPYLRDQTERPQLNHSSSSL